MKITVHTETRANNFVGQTFQPAITTEGRLESLPHNFSGSQALPGKGPYFKRDKRGGASRHAFRGRTSEREKLTRGRVCHFITLSPSPYPPPIKGGGTKTLSLVGQTFQRANGLERPSHREGRVRGRFEARHYA